MPGELLPGLRDSGTRESRSFLPHILGRSKVGAGAEYEQAQGELKLPVIRLRLI